MARPSNAARNLTLTEELERLEQSITLTLQEIDHNFSKAHRIVTTSILPLVEQYGENSRAVWEASKFWKQFFEASANVSLSGYEELNNEGDSTAVDESSALRDESSANYTSRGEDLTATPGANTTHATFEAEDSLLDDDDAELSGSTPRPPATRTIGHAEFSSHESPYEAMKREMKDEEDGQGETIVLGGEDDTSVLFAQQTARLPDMSMDPVSRFEAEVREQQSAKKSKDPLLHRILDKNYRLQTTPHKTAIRVSPLKRGDKFQSGPSYNDSPMSSPEIAVPTLRSEAFMTPYKSNARAKLAAATRGPRTPGVSVQTPGTAHKTRDVFASEPSAGPSGRYEIDYDDDDDDIDLYAGMSPPKTINFAMPPSKLLQTPAREASRRIVDDILYEAGADTQVSEYSPTMVKMNENILDDSF